jgi:hypothetical protein
VISGALEAASDFFHLPAEKKTEFESYDLTKPVRYEAALQGNNKSRILLKHYANPLKNWIHTFQSIVLATKVLCQ